MDSMFNYFEKTPVLANAIIEKRTDLVDPLVKLYNQKKYTKLVIVASGSSFNIAVTARLFLKKMLQVDVEVITPLSYTDFDNIQNNNTFILMLSQSGRSTNTIRALMKALSLNQTVAVLTTNKNSPLANQTKNVFEYGSGSNDFYVAKGFATSLLYLYLFAIMVAKVQDQIDSSQLNKYIGLLQSILKSTSSRLKDARAFYELNMQTIVNARRAMIIGVGTGYGVALEGALKINEMIGIPANAYELEEFVHGPSYEITKDHLVIFIDDNAVAHERLMEIYQATNILTDHVLLLTTQNKIGNDHELAIPDSEVQEFTSFGSILPMQCIAQSTVDDLGVLNYKITNYHFEQLIRNKAN